MRFVIRRKPKMKGACKYCGNLRRLLGQCDPCSAAESTSELSEGVKDAGGDP